ncbi:Translin [Mytilinidion resinicola]|uniref:Translin n=1 Tax=Mytilinidion resinicola TaxID=574789 RepID=A0A6A6YEJ2_9PEZI|nr:Translin [Mytilinidion resinicola]KAF2806267.1 Translin [Mytilinidion resinicola]
MADRTGMVDPAIFEDLQARIDEETSVREELRGIIQNKAVQFILARAHSTPAYAFSKLVSDASLAIEDEVKIIAKLSQAAEKLPYYKWNTMWSRQIQDATYGILLCGWLGGNGSDSQPGRLLTIEEVGGIMNVPVNLKGRDGFHLTIEEYLQALISLVDELARLARNSVTLGDYLIPILISQFIKDLHAGFQILNLKNDSLRRRSDGIKYRVKEVEDVVYDLSLRNLIPKDDKGKKDDAT